jgi:peptidoglycan/LPS O-acetylase OafA/YrhL
MAAITLGRRLQYVDGLRALAALYVMMDHITLTVWPNAFADASLPLYAHVWLYGHQVVAAFIVLSGYSLMQPGYHGALDFYRRRAKRIIPPYYLSMALSLLLIWLAIGQPTTTVWRISQFSQFSQGAPWASVFTHLALLQDFAEPDTRGVINYVYWSIALECHIYLLFPLLLQAWRRLNPARAAALIFLLSLLGSLALVLVWAALFHAAYTAFCAPWFVGCFVLGMLAATYRTHRFARRAGLFALVGAALLLPWALPLNFLLPSDYAVAIMATGCLMLNPRWLAWRPLVWIGGFSYSLYLIHAPLIQLIWQYGVLPLGFGDVASYLALLLIGGTLIILAAWGFWYLAERPFLNSRSTKNPRLLGGEGLETRSATLLTSKS